MTTMAAKCKQFIAVTLRTSQAMKSAKQKHLNMCISGSMHGRELLKEKLN